MELSPTIAESKLSDVTLARLLIGEIAQHCWNGKKDMIDRVHEAIVKKFPKSQWTHRRVRAIWHKEAAGIHWHEMCQLMDVAECAEAAAKAAEKDAKYIEEARRDHRDYIQKTASIAALLERQDADFHSQNIAGLRGAIS